MFGVRNAPDFSRIAACARSGRGLIATLGIALVGATGRAAANADVLNSPVLRMKVSGVVADQAL